MKLTTYVIALMTLVVVTDAREVRSDMKPPSSPPPRSQEDICLYKNKPLGKDNKVSDYCTIEGRLIVTCSEVWNECNRYDMNKGTCEWRWIEINHRGFTRLYPWKPPGVK